MTTIAPTLEEIADVKGRTQRLLVEGRWLRTEYDVLIHAIKRYNQHVRGFNMAKLASIDKIIEVSNRLTDEWREQRKTLPTDAKHPAPLTVLKWCRAEGVSDAEMVEDPDEPPTQEDILEAVADIMTMPTAW
jgi:hypothetical protein